MDLLKLLVREGVRRSVSSLTALALALVLALGLGVGFTSIEVAERTERAYPDYLRQADVGNMVVNPSLVFTDTEQMIRSTPGVVGLTSDALLSVMVNDDPSNFVQVRMSTDGRYASQDRPVVRDGRLIEWGAEAFLSVNAAEHLRVGVGDTLTLGFYTPQFRTGEGEATQPDPLGTEQVRVVGVGTFSDEVLVDELVPRMRVMATCSSSSSPRPRSCRTRPRSSSGSPV